MSSFNTASEVHPESHRRTLFELARHLWPQGRPDLKARVLFSLIFLFAAKALNVWVPIFLKDAIDSLSDTSRALLLPIALIVSYGIARVGVQLFGELQEFIFVNVAQHAQRSIGLQTFKRLHELSLEFHLSRQTGGLSRVIERGTRGIQFVLNFVTFDILPSLIELFFIAGILAFKFGAIYAFIILVTIVLYVVFTLVITEWRLKYRRTMNREETAANTKAIDSLLNFETVKYFGNEAHEYRRFDRSLARYEKAVIKSQLSLSFLNLIQSAIISIGLITIMLLTGQGVVDGRLTVGDFVLVNTYLIQLYLPLSYLGFIYREIKQSLIDMDKMFELMSLHPDIADAPDAAPLEISQSRIEFNDVCFGYRPDRPILKNVSFTVMPGQTVAIVGPSGAGKSTLSRLLFRFYDVDSGTIRIDGQDIRKVTQTSLRRAIGIVPQDTVLFNDTIGYNILYGAPACSFEEVQHAAESAQIAPFIQSLPDAYETSVGERGLKLSGGEKQRIAIARTILKNPPILLFDEATSALDSTTERQIQKELRHVSKNKTTLIIAHRLSTIVHADQILVLEGGKIIERGTHSELVAHQGAYARLWERQHHAAETPPI